MFLCVFVQFEAAMHRIEWNHANIPFVRMLSHSTMSNAIVRAIIMHPYGVHMRAGHAFCPFATGSVHSQRRQNKHGHLAIPEHSVLASLRCRSMCIVRERTVTVNYAKFDEFQMNAQYAATA